MKPSFRLLRVLAAPSVKVSNPVARPTAENPQAETVTRWRVLPSDVDLFGHMNNSRYLLLMDFARVDYLRRTRLLESALTSRWIMPVAAVNVDFYRPLKPFERFEILTQVLSWDDRWFFMRQTFRTRTTPVRTAATGYVKTIVRSPSGVVAPAQLARIVGGREVEPPVLPDHLRTRFCISPRAAAGEHTAPQTPRHNGHSLVDIDAPWRAVAR
jgi:acyl-CoA thioesterase FadM